jgi:hypothetical protein
MIVLALLISKATTKNSKVIIERREWFLLILGSVVLIFGFCLDYSQFVIENYGFNKLFVYEEEIVREISTNYVPQHFNWWIFTLGSSIISVAIYLFYKRNTTPK